LRRRAGRWHRRGVVIGRNPHPERRPSYSSSRNYHYPGVEVGIIRAENQFGGWVKGSVIIQIDPHPYVFVYVAVGLNTDGRTGGSSNRGTNGTGIIEVSGRRSTAVSGGGIVYRSVVYIHIQNSHAEKQAA